MPRHPALRKAVFAVAALIVLGMVAISYRQWKQYSNANNEAAASADIDNSVDALISSLLDAETGQRGYLLTGQSQYLDPYNQAIGTVPGEVAHLDRLLASRPGQSANVAQLDSLVNQKLNEMRQTVAARQAGEAQNALAIVLSDRGQREMARIRSLGAHIQRDERSARLKASADREAAAATALVITVAGSILLLLLFAFGLEPFASGDPQARARSWTIRYGAALLAVVAAALLRMALTPLLGPLADPLITFFPAVLFAAWYGGFRAGVLSTVLSGLTGMYFFMEPTKAFAVFHHKDQVALLVFVLAGFGMSLLSLSQGRAVERAIDAEDAERNERQRFQITLASIGDAVIATDARGSVAYMNAVAEELTGWPSSDAAAQPLEAVFRIINEKSRQTVDNPIKKVLAQGHTVGLANHTLLIARDGRERAIDDSAAPIRDREDKIVGVVLIFRDVTEQQQAQRDREARLIAEESLRATLETNKKLENAEESLRQLSVRLMAAQDEERRRIARELHDSVGQHLAHAKLSLEMFLEKPGEENDSENLATIVETLNQCMIETRTISHLLHPPLLDELGFATAARVYAQGFAKRSGIAVDLHIPPEMQRLPNDRELVLFRVLQESLTNVLRHARSESVDIRVEANGGRVSLAVRDHGTGMPRGLVERVLAGTGGGVGLSGMRERIVQFGGHFEIESSAQGTLIRATLPVATAQPEQSAAASADD
jgi:PAS domain S-box-containing protein